MQKMKYGLYNKIIEDNTLSRLEIKMIFWLAAHQDESGRVDGVYFQSIADDLGCSVSGFYLTRDSLDKKGYIIWDKSYTGDMDIILNGNNFISETGEAEYRDYVDLNIAIFHDAEFLKCKAGAIRTAMYFIKRAEAQKAVTLTNSPSAATADAEKARKLWFNPLKCISTLKKLLKITTRMVKEYIKLISEWISSASVHNDGTVYTVITVLAKSLKQPTDRSSYPERQAYIQKVKTYIRRQKIDSTNKNTIDTADLIRQYRRTAKQGKLNITDILYTAISNTCSSVLNSINVHKSLKNLINYNCPGIL